MPAKPKTTNATKRKLKAAKTKTIAPMTESRLATINAQRVKQGLQPQTLAEANSGLGAPAKKGKPAKAEKPAKVVVPVVLIPPSCLPVQQLFSERIVRRESGLIELKPEATASEAVSLISFLDSTQRSAGMLIGIIVIAMEKTKKATLDQLAASTKLERKTLINMASAMRGTSIATLEGAMKKAAKSGHQLGFTHVAAVAGLDPDKKKLLLEDVAENGLTVKELNSKVAKLAPKTAKRASAEKKRAAKQAAADAAALAAKEATAKAAVDGGGANQAPGAPGGDSGASGVVVVDSPLSEDDEKTVEAAETKMDEIATFLKTKTFELLPKKRKVQILSFLKPMHAMYLVLLEELPKAK